ncbi:DUF3800 domain-containing protein [Paracoccus sp. TD-10]|uniref:DUF3800 domain-containing protein n=1 Tax=Paracoccus sp. TD-10 TaxID=3395918 RepID=UPI003AB0717B
MGRTLIASGGKIPWQVRVNRNFGDVDFQPIFSKKSENSVGLQLADLTARPIAINVLRPQQANRAFDIIAPKIRNRKTFP